MIAKLLSPETFEFFARYLLAGYVVILVRSRFVHGARTKTGELLIEAVIFSLLVQAALYFTSPALGWFWSVIGTPFTLPGKLTLFAEVLLIPAILGFILGKNLSSGWNNAILRKLSMPIVHPARRAHDFAFGNDRNPCLVILTYDDGTVVRGYFGENSLAASDDARSDIYLERLYDEDQDGQWVELSPGRSGLISLAGLRSIEFLDEEEAEDGSAETHDAG